MVPKLQRFSQNLRQFSSKLHRFKGPNNCKTKTCPNIGNIAIQEINFNGNFRNQIWNYGEDIFRFGRNIAKLWSRYFHVGLENNLAKREEEEQGEEEDAK